MPVCWPGLDFSETKIAFAHAGGIGLHQDRVRSHPLVQAAGGANRPRFSPDGQMLAFEADFGDGHDLWTMPSGGGIPIRLTDHPTRRNLVWMDTRRRGAVLCPRHQGAPEGLPKSLRSVPKVDPSNNFRSRMAPGPTSTPRATIYTPWTRDHRSWKRVPRWDGHRPLDERWSIGLPLDHIHRHRHAPMWHNGKVHFLSDNTPNHRLGLFRLDDDDHTLGMPRLV